MRVSLANLLIIVAALSVVLIAALAAVRVARYWRDRALRHHKAPALVMPLSTPPARTSQPNAAREAAYLRLEQSQTALAPGLEVFPPAHPRSDEPRSNEPRSELPESGGGPDRRGGESATGER